MGDNERPAPPKAAPHEGDPDTLAAIGNALRSAYPADNHDSVSPEMVNILLLLAHHPYGPSAPPKPGIALPVQHKRLKAIATKLRILRPRKD